MPNIPNYAREMDKVLQSLAGRRPRLLLHACCGPCSSAVLEQLCQYFDITILYYNPNIWPAAEYHRREQELERFVAEAHPLGVQVVEDRYDPDEFYAAARGLETEPERGARCTACYRLRMRRAAEYAAANGFDWFTTTLSISPHKDAARINQIGQELAAQYGVPHLPSDFKKKNGYLRSLQLSAEYTARAIRRAIAHKRRVAIINWPYAVLVFFWRLLPRCVWKRMSLKTAKH